MKAAILERYGPPGNIQVREVEKPNPQSREILVKVKASGVSRAHTMMRAGDPFIARFAVGFPRPKVKILGTGFSGEIVGMAADVTEFSTGDAVFGDTGLAFGANAEYLAVNIDKSLVVKKPEAVRHTDASTWGDGALTAFNFLFNVAKAKPGQRILIIGASGAIGSFAVQFAARANLDVTAVCSAANADLVSSLGAHRVVDYRTQSVETLPGQFDIIFDTIGAARFTKVRRLLVTDGLYMSPKISLSLAWAMLRTKIAGTKRALFSATGLLPVDQAKSQMIEMYRFIKKYKIKTIIDSSYKLEDLEKLHAHIEAGHKTGNIALTM